MDEKFVTEGWKSFGVAFRTKALLNQILMRRQFDSSLFMTAEEFESTCYEPSPEPGRNMMDQLGQHERRMWVGEDTAILDTWLRVMLGDGRTVLGRQIVVSVPEREIPEWLWAHPYNLGAFVKPQYKDVVYVRGWKWRQDIRVAEKVSPDFLILYVYLNDVALQDGPVRLLKGSHKAGKTDFPHAVRKLNTGYGYDVGATRWMCREQTLCAPAGSAFVWHPYTLNSQGPVESDEPRIALRYLIGREPVRKVGIDEVNEVLE